jgi:hypothetical protein
MNRYSAAIGKGIFAPDNSHQLAPDNGVTAVSANAQIEINRGVTRGVEITCYHAPLVEVHGLDLMLKKYADIGHGRYFI